MGESKNTQKYRYEVFLCFRHAQPDESAAKYLCQTAKRFYIPSQLAAEVKKRRLGRICTSPQEQDPEIHAVLEDSRIMMVLCSPRIMESAQCMQEIDTFVAQGKRGRIFPVLIEGEAVQSVPPQLRGEENTLIDARGETVKEICRKLRRGKLSYLAPMIPAPYEEVKRCVRERTTRVFAAGMTAAAVLFAALGIFLGVRAVGNDRLYREAVREEVTALTAGSESFLAEGNTLSALKSLLQAEERCKTLAPDPSLDASLEEAVSLESFGTLEKIGYSGLSGLSFSPDGTKILAIYGGNTAILLDAATGNAMFTVGKSREKLDIAAFSADGQYFLTASFRENTVSVWKSQDGKSVATYRSVDDDSAYTIGSAAFYGETSLLIKEKDRLVEWNFKNQSIRVVFKDNLSGYADTYTAAALSPDLSMVAPGCAFGGKIPLISVSDGTVQWIENKDGSWYCLTFSPSGEFLAGVSQGKASVWNVNTKEQIFLMNAGDTWDSSFAPVFSPDSAMLALPSVKGVKVYEISSGRLLYDISGTESSSVWNTEFSPDGKYLIASDQDRFGVFEAQNGKTVYGAMRTDGYPVTFSPDGRMLLAGDRSGLFRLCAMPEISVTNAVTSYSGTLFNTERQSALQKTDALISLHASDPAAEQGKPSRQYSDPSGTYAAVPYADGFIEVWDVTKSTKPLCGIAAHQATVNDVLFSSSGLMASCASDGSVAVFDLKAQKLRYVFDSGKSAGRMAFDESGDYLMVLSGDTLSAAVYSVNTGRRLFTLYSEEGKIREIGFDGETAVISFSDGTAVTGKLFPTKDALLERANSLASGKR